MTAPRLMLAALLATGCTHVVNTVPRPISPADPVSKFDLVVPKDLEVRSADFDATMFASAGGGRDYVTSDVGGRAFIKLFAVHRVTGEQYLLVYEDVAKRKEPTFIIHLVAGS